MALPTLRAFRTVFADIILYGIKQRKYMHNILVKIEQLFMIIISHNNCDQVNTPWGKKPQRLTYYIDFIIIFYIIILILFELYLVINIIIIIKLMLYSYL